MRNRLLSQFAALAWLLGAIPTPALSQTAPYPRTGFRAELQTVAHNVSGQVTIVDEDTLFIEHFYYDGGGASVYFYLGPVSGTFAFGNGLRIGPQLLGTVFQDASFPLDLPAGHTLDGYNAVSVWCELAQFSFGHGPFLQIEPESYCTPTTSALGCAPTIHSSGLPRASGAAFEVTVDGARNRRAGLWIYGPDRASLPFGSGVLCVSAPQTRTAARLAGGSPVGDDCTGFYRLDFDAWMQSGVDPRLVPGASVCVQLIQRDRAVPGGLALSDALAFHIAP